MGRRMMVTGGAGFLGSHLCERLVADGSPGPAGNVAQLRETGSFRLVRSDVTDFVHVPGAVDAVPHFASPASPVDYSRRPIATLEVGSIGTLHDPCVRQPDITLARERLAWEPTVLVSTGLLRTVDWFRDHLGTGSPEALQVALRAAS